MATLTVLGAAEGVTGSAYLLDTGSTRVLLECGLVRGNPEEELANAAPFEFDVAALDAVVLSHAHLDHSGRLPRLVAAGYSGPVHATRGTVDLLDVLLKDAASLERRDAEWENKRRRRAGRDEIEPLYTLKDVEATLALCEGAPYDEYVRLSEDVRVRFLDAGHILGSAVVELFVGPPDHLRKLVFSGDLGNDGMALMRPAATVAAADLVLLESTYGDRNHRPMAETLAEFEGIIEAASESGGNILIPAFAVGRTQEMLFRLGAMYQQGRLRQQRVWLDSPMAIAATEIYHRHQHTFRTSDREALGRGASASLHTFLPTLRYARSTAESMALNRIESGAIIIAGSGMCNGGRIRHHLKHNLWKSAAHVVIVGYQARGTPGRALVDGAKRLHVAGEDVAVKATIHTLGGFSAHAGQSQLVAWAQAFEAPVPGLYLIHGEAQAKAALKARLADVGLRAVVPEHGDVLPF